ncbi:MAG: DNA-processing protein DprA [Geminicoccaceae bacterium]
MNRQHDPDEDLLTWLQLARCDGVGPITFATLLERYQGVTAALRAARQQPLPGGAPRRVPERAALIAEIEALGALEGHMLVKAGADYPPLLRALPDAPPVISVCGRTELLHRPAVAIVGARNASANGCGFARTLARELAKAELVIVSGLARGIDTAAHEGALAAAGATVAVIAAGVDVVYPPENAALMRRIASDGAVVSERPLGATARAKDFPRRNRVIAGLSLGVVVVEAAPASGSLITARLALEYGREVMAVPGSPMDPRHRGTNQLLRDGAHLVESAADILAVLAPLLQQSEPPALRSRRMRRALQSEPSTVAADLPTRSETLADRVVRALGPEPLAVDELIRECDAASPDVQAALLDLELAGRIDRQPGNRVCLRAG